MSFGRNSSEGRRIEKEIRQAEERAESGKQARVALCKAALLAGLANRYAQRFEARLALDEGLPLELWPEAAPLAPGERRLVLRELRKLWDLPLKHECHCKGGHHLGCQNGRCRCDETHREAW